MANAAEKFLSAVLAFAGTDHSAEAVATFHAEVGTIHHSTRTANSTAALKRVATDHGPMAVIAVVDALDTIPGAESATRTVSLSDESVASLRSTAAGYVLATFAEDAIADMVAPIPEDERGLATEWLSSLSDRIAALIEKAPTGTRQNIDGSLSDLIGSGALAIGTTLYGSGKYSGVAGEVTADGIMIDGEVYANPSAAYRAATGLASSNGWHGWRIGAADGVRLGTLR